MAMAPDANSLLLPLHTYWVSVIELVALGQGNLTAHGTRRRSKLRGMVKASTTSLLSLRNKLS